MEFIWNAPGNAASILGIHLILGYGSVADLNLKRRGGQYKMALKRIRKPQTIRRSRNQRTPQNTYRKTSNRKTRKTQNKPCNHAHLRIQPNNHISIRKNSARLRRRNPTNRRHTTTNQ